jgi:hypothetical protein
VALVRLAEPHELGRAARLEVLEDLLRELGVPALRADELAGEVAYARECLARVGVERDVLAEEERVAGLTEDLLLGGLECALAGGGDDLHQPAVCLGAFGSHLSPTVAPIPTGVTAPNRGWRPTPGASLAAVPLTRSGEARKGQ